MKHDHSHVNSIVDALLLPLAFVAAIASIPVSRWSSKLPFCVSIFDRFNVYPIRHHYHSPLVYESDLRESLVKPRVIRGLDLNDSAQLDILKNFNFREELLEIPYIASSPLSFGYKNNAFGVGDAEYLYNMIRQFKPKQLLEIGCGQSTLMAQLAIEANRRDDTSYKCRHICVEPFEQSWLEQLGVTVYRTKIENLDSAIVSDLHKNDILFIDSSHVIRPQGDVLYEYLNIVGQLNTGVLAHVHDVFTPHDYPEEWVINDRRLWNEQYLLEAFLCFNKSFRIIGALNYLWHNYRHLMTHACPVLSQKGGEPGSFWFTRVE
jgi:Methyltransferase domain